ncbi:MAG: tetratricopeptide repeat protein [Candidatus Acidiferrales bacterium]
MASKWTKLGLGWLIALALAMSALPLMAQTGGLTGTAKGVDGNKLAGYPIIIERTDIKGTYKTKTNKHGNYVYIGLPIGNYKVVLDSPSGQQLYYIEKHVGLGDPTEVDFDLAKEKGAQDALAAIQAKKEDAALQAASAQATALFNQQKYADAAAAFAKTVPLATGKNQGVLLYDEGTSYFKMGDYQKAADTVEQAIAKDPDNKQYHAALAASDVKLGKTQEAQEEFKKAGMSVDLKALAQNAKASKENETFKNLKQTFDAGNSLYTQGQYAQAATTFEKAIPMAKAKNLPVVLSRAADSWDKAKQYDKAVADYQKAIAADPTNAGYMNNLGTIYGHMGKPDLAVQEFQKAAQTDPTGAARYDFNTGAILMNAGKLDQAAAAFKQAAQTDPKYADAYFLEAQALMGKATVGANGKVVPAPGTVEALQSYLQEAPNGKYAASAQQMLQTLTGKVQTKYQRH